MSVGFFSVVVVFAIIWSWGSVEKLLLATLFFAPFSSSVVIQVGDTFLQPGHVLLLVLLIAILSKGKIRLRKPDPFITAFMVWCIVSIFIAGLFRFDVSVYGIGNGVELTSSKVSTQAFTQYIYLFCGYILYLLTYTYASRCIENKKKIIETFALSTIIILFICLYQYIASIFSLPYDVIFRNTMDTWQSIDRLQGVMPEASFLAQQLVLSLPIALLYFKDKKMALILFCSMMLFVGIYSRSSTFLIGLIAVTLVYIFISRKTLKNLIGCFVAVLLIIIGTYLAYEYIPIFTRLVDLTIAKFNQTTISGIERASVSAYMFDVWKQYPISGIGYGCGRSLNLYTNLLATTGIVGFNLYFIPLCRWTIYFFFQRKDNTMLTIFIFLVGYWVTSIAIPDITYLNIWGFLGLANSCMKKNAFSLARKNTYPIHMISTNETNL